MPLSKKVILTCLSFILFIKITHAQIGKLSVEEDKYFRKELSIQMTMNSSLREGTDMKIISFSRAGNGMIEKVRGQYEYTSPALKGSWIEIFLKDDFLYCVVYSTNPQQIVMPGALTPPNGVGAVKLNPYSGYLREKALSLQSTLNLTKDQNVNTKIKAQDDFTTINIAQNFNLLVAGKYPDGFSPIWYNVDRAGLIEFNLYQTLSTRARDQKVSIPVMITQNNNKTVIVFDKWYATLDTDNTITTLTDKPITFELKDFKVYTSGGNFTEKKIEESTNSYYAGGMEGSVSLSGNIDGDIVMSLKIEIYKKQTKNYTSSLSYRYTLQDYTIQNRMSIAHSKQVLAARKQQKISDSLYKIARIKEEEEKEASFELSIKNSYAKVKQQQNDYKAVYNPACLKIDKGRRLESSSHTERVATTVAAPYDPSTGRFTDVEMQDKVVSTSYWVDYEGLKNTCENPIVIYGIKKLKSPAGTIYYENFSYYLESSEMTNDIISIEKSYNPVLAEINSVHFYTQKLK